ncbi:MAG TPA: hypothetical protein VF239_19650, partial [Vicinamibacterales bacterium]
MQIFRGMLAAALTAAVAIAQIHAVTRVPSADGQFWDVQDTSPWSQDSGGIATGGRSNPFNGFGYLKLQIRRGNDAVLARNYYLRGFGLHHDGKGRFDSITPVFVDGVVVDRNITTQSHTNYLRYVDTLTNTTDEDRVVRVAWGGAVGAYQDGGLATVATTSDGDREIELTDSFVTMMQNAKDSASPQNGPSGHGPSAHVVGDRQGIVTAVGDMYADPFESRWPGFDPAHIGYVFTLRLRPGQSSSLMTFVVKGRSEVYDPRGGYPVPFKDALITGDAPYAGADAHVPPAGSEIVTVTEMAKRLAASPDTAGLTPLQRSRIVNWQLEPREWPAFSVFEKTVVELQQAMENGVTTSEDITREYLARISTYDKHGPQFRSILSLNPRAIADARE